MSDRPVFIRAKEVQQYGKTSLIRLDTIARIEFRDDLTLLHLSPHGDFRFSDGMSDSGTSQSIAVSKEDGEAICRLLNVLNPQS